MKSSSLINNTKKCDNFGNWSRNLRHISAVSFRFRSPQLHRFNKVISQYMTNSQNVSQLTSGYNPGHPGSKILLRFKEQRRTVHISLSSKAVRTRLYARASRASWHVRMQLVTWHIHMHTRTHTHTRKFSSVSKGFVTQSVPLLFSVTTLRQQCWRFSVLNCSSEFPRGIAYVPENSRNYAAHSGAE